MESIESIFPIINLDNPAKSVESALTQLYLSKFKANVMFFYNEDTKKIVGSKLFKSFSELDEYMFHLPFKYKVLIFYVKGYEYYLGARLANENWLYKYDGENLKVQHYVKRHKDDFKIAISELNKILDEKISLIRKA